MGVAIAVKLRWDSLFSLTSNLYACIVLLMGMAWISARSCTPKIKEIILSKEGIDVQPYYQDQSLEISNPHHSSIKIFVKNIKLTQNLYSTLT